MRAWVWWLGWPLAGCALLGGEQPDRSPVTWRPFRIAHIAHPEVGPPGSAARLLRAGAVLARDRYLDAVVVGGRLGTASPERIAELLAAVGKPVVVVRPDDVFRRAHQPFRGLLLLTLARGHAAAAAAGVRELDADLRGRWVGLALDGPLVSGDEASPAESDLAYAVEALERIRVLLTPAESGALERRAGLVVVRTGALAGGTVRMLAIRGHTLRTWQRPLHGTADENPLETGETTFTR